MSTSLKLLIPLLSKHFTKTIISEKTGFINAFTDDVNKPYLDNHIFLMYDISKPTNKETFKRINELKKEGIKHYAYTKDTHMYYIYAIPMKNQSAYAYKATLYPFFTQKDRVQIGAFWGDSDETINNFISNPNYHAPKFERSIIPEMETPNIFHNAYNKNCTGGITVTRAI